MTFGSTILLSLSLPLSPSLFPPTLSAIHFSLSLPFSSSLSHALPAVYGRRGASYLNDARSGIRSSCFFSFRNA